MEIHMIEKEVLNKLYIIDNLSMLEISKIYGVCCTTIGNYLKKYNISKKDYKVKYKANNDFFKKWTPESAYCLGFIASDGHVWKNRPFLTIGIHKQDIDVLEYIRDNISPDSKIRISKNICQICVFSREIHEDLNRIGISHDKTFNLKFPDIPKEYIGDFVRGFFDGDGCIWSTDFGKKQKTYYYANIISASKDFIFGLQKVLGFGKVRCVRNKYYEIVFCQSSCLKLKEIMYGENKFCMYRKFIKFTNINHTPEILWTKEEDNIIEQNIHTPVKELIRILPNRTKSAIATRKKKFRNESFKNK